MAKKIDQTTIPGVGGEKETIGEIIPTHKGKGVTIGTEEDKGPIIGPMEDNGKNDAKLGDVRIKPAQSRIFWIIEV